MFYFIFIHYIKHIIFVNLLNSEAVVKPLVSGILFQTCVDFLLRAVAVLLGYFNLSFANKNMKDLCDMFELNHLMKNPTCFKGSNPLLVISILTKRQGFLIHLLSRLEFRTTIVWLVQCFARHFVKIQQN